MIIYCNFVFFALVMTHFNHNSHSFMLQMCFKCEHFVFFFFLNRMIETRLQLAAKIGFENLEYCNEYRVFEEKFLLMLVKRSLFGYLVSIFITQQDQLCLRNRFRFGKIKKPTQQNAWQPSTCSVSHTIRMSGISINEQT